MTASTTEGIEPGQNAPRMMGVAPFVFEMQDIGSVLSIRLRGELDIAVAEEVRSSLEEPLRGPGRVVVLDVGGVTFCDSTGLGMLMRLKRTVESGGGRLLITRVSRPMLKLLEVSGIASLFEYLDGTLVDATCPVCDLRMPPDAVVCPHCGAV